MPNTKAVTPETEKPDTESIMKWIDGLAKIVVVITALLYVVGRNYTESYYAHMGLPTSNLPLTLQEYLFMSTRSLSFLKSAVSASIISIVSGLFFNFSINGVQMLMETLVGRFSKDSKKEKQETPKAAEAPKKPKKDEKEVPDLEEINPKEPRKKRQPDNELILEFQGKLKNWLKGKLIYIIPTFIVLVFAMLIPSAKASGGTDSELAIQNAPLGRVLLNQPSIPEITPQIYTMQNNEVMYDYGELPVIGTLGDNYLFVLENQNGKKTILSVPIAQIVSINYVSFVSLSTPTSTATPSETPIPATSTP